MKKFYGGKNCVKRYRQSYPSEFAKFEEVNGVMPEDAVIDLCIYENGVIGFFMYKGDDQ